MRFHLILFLMLSMVLLMVNSRHIQPGHKRRHHHAKATDIPPQEEDFENIPENVLQNVKQSRFVPINNQLFFKTFEACDEGFKRDFLGICREVWD